MTKHLLGKRVAIIATDLVEQVELVEPRRALEDAGTATDLPSLALGKIRGVNHHEHADAHRVDRLVAEADPDDYDAVCHGHWVLVEADIVRNHTVTSFPSVQTDLRNAGGTWIDEEVVSDGGLVTSCNPPDISAFNERMIEEFAAGARRRRRTFSPVVL